MAGIKSVYSNLLGISNKVRIESRGLINPPRLAALAMSNATSTPLGNLVGGLIGGVMGGSAMRPLDMIFPEPGSRRPVIKASNISAGTSYYVRETPYPPSLIGKVLSGQQTLKGAAISTASSLLRKKLFPPQKPDSSESGYGPKYGKKSIGGAYFGENRFTTEYYANGASERGETTKLKQVYGKNKPPFELLIHNINEGTTTATLSDAETAMKDLQTGFVLFQMYGDENNAEKNILLPATVSGISETVTPEWQNFRYVGSPFNTYRYGGVERSIKLNIKPFADSISSRENMQRNLDKIRRMAFPDENISEIKYDGDVIYGINPNLWYLTIHGYYKKLLGIVTDVSISVDDNVPWPQGDQKNNPYQMETVSNEPYPVVVNVSVGMKIVEDFPINGSKIYYMDGILSKMTGKDIPEPQPGSRPSADENYGRPPMPPG